MRKKITKGKTLRFYLNENELKLLLLKDNKTEWIESNKFYFLSFGYAINIPTNRNIPD